MIQIHQGSASGRNVPKIVNGYVCSGNGAVFVAPIGNPDLEIDITADLGYACYQMGAFDDTTLYVLEFLNGTTGRILAFDSTNKWAMTEIYRGPCLGTSEFASGGHWSTYLGGGTAVVDGATWTPSRPMSGWMPSGHYTSYKLTPGFTSIIIESLNHAQVYQIDPPDGTTSIDNGWQLFDLGLEVVATFTAGGRSWHWDSFSAVSMPVNLAALQAAGYGESSALVLQLTDHQWIATWTPANSNVYVRPVGNTTCISLIGLPGEFMAFAAQGQFQFAGNTQPYQLATATCDLTEPLLAPVVPSQPPAPLVTLDPSPHTYALAPWKEVVLDTNGGGILASLDAGTNAGILECAWHQRAGGRDKLMFTGPDRMGDVPVMFRGGYIGALSEGDSAIDNQVIAAFIATCQRDRLPGFLNIDGFRIADRHALLRYFQPGIYPIVEFYLQGSATAHIDDILATSEAAWRRDCDVLEATFGRDVHGLARFGIDLTFYTQTPDGVTDHWPLAAEVRAQAIAKRLVNEYGIAFVAPFCINRGGLVMHPQIFGPILQEWISTNGDGPLPAFEIPAEDDDMPTNKLVSPSGNCFVQLQDDGNFVVYDNRNPAKPVPIQTGVWLPGKGPLPLPKPQA